MKALYDIRRYSGGAALSLLAWAKVAQSAGWQVVAISEQADRAIGFRDAGIKVYEAPAFDGYSPIKNIAALYRYYRIIQMEKPNLVLANRMPHCPFIRLLSKATDVPALFFQAGGIASNTILKIMKDEQYVVYSEENRKQFENCGFPPNKVQVITNRIASANMPKFDVSRYSGPTNEVRCVIIGRLEPDKFNSILHVLALIRKLVLDGYLISLNILGDGRERRTVSRHADKINSEAGRSVVKICGHQADVSDFLHQSHICFGKGRSALDGIFAGRLTCVVNEHQRIECVSPANFDTLMAYNFSGRNLLGVTDYNMLKQLIVTVCEGRVSTEQLSKLASLARKYYDVGLAKSKIMALCQERAREHQVVRFRFSRAAYEFIRIYFLFIRGLVAKRLFGQVNRCSSP